MKFSVSARACGRGGRGGRASGRRARVGKRAPGVGPKPEEEEPEEEEAGGKQRARAAQRGAARRGVVRHGAASCTVTQVVRPCSRAARGGRSTDELSLLRARQCSDRLFAL